MLSRLLSLLFPQKSPPPSQTDSSKSLASSASSQVQSQESSSNPAWISKATNQIKKDEGIVLHVYDDSLGYSTIGYGRLVDRRKGGGISEDEALYLLKNDVNAICLYLRV